MMAEPIKGILMDYGGTMDTVGRHWANVLYSLYEDQGISIQRTDFDEAYIYGEKMLATKSLIKPDFNFQQVLAAKLNLQFEFLRNKGIVASNNMIEILALEGYLLVNNNIESVKGVLAKIYQHVPLVMVSNFYGNLTTVLKDFGIYQYFDSIVESAVVGIRKPDSRIYKEGLKRLGQAAEKTVMIGDSYTKDIIPAKHCGCQTIWLKGETWQAENIDSEGARADYIVRDWLGLEAVLEELLQLHR